MNINSESIKSLLSIKHRDDFFLTEVKNGSTWSSDNNLRLDAWAMKKSWASPLTIGYEIKVSRQDFLNDNKWHGYLKYCNEFYFVAPKDVISPEELPKDVGLLVVSSKGKFLFKKKKAIYRDLEIPEPFYRYILMSRAIPQKVWNNYLLSDEDTHEGRIKYWSNWLESRREIKFLGKRISKALQNTIKERIEQVEEENMSLKNQIKGLNDVREFLKKEGFDLDINKSHSLLYVVKSRVEQMREVVPHDLMFLLRTLSDYINRIIVKVETGR